MLLKIGLQIKLLIPKKYLFFNLKNYLYIFLSLVCFQQLFSQDYELNKFDLSNEELEELLWIGKLDKDTIFAIVKMENPLFPSFGEDIRSALVSIDSNGNILNKRIYNWLNPSHRGGNSMSIDSDTIIVVDNLGQVGNDKIQIFLADKNLDSISLDTIEVFENAPTIIASSVVKFDNYFVVSGWGQLENSSPDFLAWINANTMGLDTIIKFQDDNITEGIDFLEVVNDTLFGVWDTSNGFISSRGFIGYDENKNQVFFYQDSKDSTITQSVNLYFIGTNLTNGNKIYIQYFDWIGKIEIICVDRFGEEIWSNKDSPNSISGKVDYTFIKELENNEILLGGKVFWHYFWDGTIENYPDDPDTLRFYQAPYLMKVNAITGETIWKHAVIENTNYDVKNQATVMAKAFELSDGSIIGFGPYDIYNNYGQAINSDSWVLKLPSDACLIDVCGFESYLDVTTNIKAIPIIDKTFEIIPNPVEKSFSVKNSEYFTNNSILNIYNINGSIIHSEILKTENQIINIDKLLSSKYIVAIIDESSKIIYSNILIKI